jgi:hypothetical protein
LLVGGLVAAAGLAVDPAVAERFLECLVIGEAGRLCGALLCENQPRARRLHVMVGQPLQRKPVTLGSGKRLFGDTSDKKSLRLADSKVVGDGVAILIYEPTV